MVREGQRQTGSIACGASARMRRGEFAPRCPDDWRHAPRYIERETDRYIIIDTSPRRHATHERQREVF